MTLDTLLWFAVTYAQAVLAVSAGLAAARILIGPRAVLLRGPSGAGKSDLAYRLIRGEGPSAMLVADDRVALAVEEGRLIASPRGSITSSMLGRMSPRPASISLTRMT